MNEIKSMLVCRRLNDEQKKSITGALPNTEIIFDEEDESVELLERVDMIYGNVTPEMVKYCKNLKWLQLGSSGADMYKGYVPDGVVVTSATGAYGEVISEHMLGCLLTLQNRFLEYYDNQKQGVWHFVGHKRYILGSTCVVLGMGDIGGCFARKMKALGAYVIGVRRTDARKPEYCDELYLTDELDKVLPRADILAMAMPNSPETTGILSAQRIQALKPGAYVINVGRGTAVDQDALCQGLNSGHLGGACLDVTVPEPLPAEHPLWNAKNILITPHISGGRMKGHASERIMEIFFENLHAWQNGLPMRSVVDMSTGYRKVEG